MSDIPRLTDPIALKHHRARAGDMFLQTLAHEDIEERLTMINRRFENAAVVTPFADVWADLGTPYPEKPVLDLAPVSHDLIIHAMGLHWADDPVGQLIQCKHALKPDGLFLAALIGGRSLQELRDALVRAEVALTGGISPRVLPISDIRDMGALLQRAGFAMAVADSQIHRVRYESLTHLMQDLRQSGEQNALYARRRNFTHPALFRRASEIYAETYPGEDGGIIASFEIIYLSGWAPAEDHPQPKRPGSAVMRLADALGSIEQPLRD